MVSFQSFKELISATPKAVAKPASAVIRKDVRFVRTADRLVEVVENNFETDGMVTEFIPRTAAGA